MRRLASFAVLGSIVALLAACSKKPVPTETAPPPPPPEAPTVTELAPLVEDAGDVADAAEASAPRKWTGGAATNSNQVKIKACCNAMRSQARQLGSSPEAFQINAFAVQCDTFASQVGPQGTAPELNQVRQMLKSINLPAACQF